MATGNLGSVAVAAEWMRVSQRRVRRLLEQGRLAGYKDASLGEWRVVLPPSVKAGRRGPAMRFKRPL